MAYLQRCEGGRRITLGAVCLVGRERHCTLRLSHAFVSGLHARLSWHDDQWLVRDLGSRNGTLVYPTLGSVRGTLAYAGRPDAALVVTLFEGALIEFGGEQERWCLGDASAPRACARREDGKVVVADNGVITILGNGQTLCVVAQQADARWKLQLPSETKPVFDQQQIELSDGRWTLELPADLSHSSSTVTHGPASVERAAAWSRSQLALHISVSHDGDDIDVVFRGGGRSLRLAGYVFNELLLSLAHARLEDRQTHPSRHASEHGWVTVEKLLRLPTVRGDPRRIPQLVHALRGHLRKAGVADYDGIVQARAGKRRVGVSKITIAFL